ncbi:MAG: tRNA(Met) cytidine acetyltransferase TmcA [Haloarculaceae archaeon]
MDDVVASLAAALRAQARSVNERRLLVLAGDADRTRAAAETALDAAGVERGATTLVGPAAFLACERYDQRRADRLLGRTRTAVVLDAHEGLRPNALGQAVGAVDGGGLLVLLVPPLSEWPERSDAFGESLAVPPYEREDVTGRFRSRLVALVRVHPGVAVLDCDAGVVEREGLTSPAPVLDDGEPGPRPPADHVFPTAAYDACLTDDQVTAVAALERLTEPDRAVVVEADRGRGKSSAAGLAAGSLALSGVDVLVTAPIYRSAAEVFTRAAELLTDRDALAGRDRADQPRELRTGAGRVRYCPPATAAELPDDPDAVVVDEAAGLPVRRLSSFLAAPAVAFTTTVHGYEGAGRGFSVRFRDRLDESDHAVTDVSMREPIRYAAGDPLEVWAFRALLLDAGPAVDPLVEAATPATVACETLSPDRLLDDEHLLRESFGLLVLAHYRTEPNDLARLLDAPNVYARALLYDGHVASVALLAREGGLDADRRADMYAGGRIRGNMLPDVLTTQLRDERAGETVGWRVLRIATHPAVRSRGLGSRLLADVRAEAADADLDWLGVGYGATPELVRFWATNGFGTVHLSTTRNDASGEHSAVMLDPLSPAGRRLRDRHATWFRRRVASMLSDPLSDLDADVVRAALRATPGTVDPDLDDWEWRLVVGTTAGAGLFDTAPRPFRRLALAHLVDPSDRHALTDREERLLVLKVLQGRSWSAVADALDYVSPGACMRALGDLTETLLDRFGTDLAARERERLS